MVVVVVLVSVLLSATVQVHFSRPSESATMTATVSGGRTDPTSGALPFATGGNDWLGWASPLGRFFPAAAYDSESDRVILFGGRGGPTGYLDDTWAYDHNRNAWTNVTQATKPSARQSHAMAYDSRFDRVILFGGSDGSGYPDDTSAYDFNTDTWTNMNPANPPPFRYAPAMAYDSQSERVILFGGANPDYLDDTWAYDLNANTWANPTQATKPSARVDHAMAYDSQSDRVILFGGFGPYGYLDDTWAYDLNANTWANPTQATKPSARVDHAMAYDSQSDRVILFGGRGPSGVLLDDTWTYDFNTNTWTNMTQAARPSFRAGHTVTYDSESDRLILFGGRSAADTWAYDLETNAWTNTNPATKPSTLVPVWAYDSESDRVILFAGSGGIGALNDTWAYDLETNAWTNTNPANPPSPRADHAMAYDSESDRIILFGGSIATSPYVSDETWAYDFNANAWTDMNPANPPPSRYWHALAYDSQSDRVILFGGFASSGEPLNDTWAYDFNANAWTDMNPVNPPPARYFHAMTYDSQSDRVILFGGYGLPTGFLGDTWSYDLNTDTWTNMNPLNPPPPRYALGMSYDSQSDRVILFGGSDGSGYPDDTWAYDFNANTWTNVSPANPPPARYFHAMTYDSQSDRVIVFGGIFGGLPYRYNDIWAYDFDLNHWAPIRDAPSARCCHALAYDVESDRTVLFGGYTLSGVYPDDTWAFDLNTKAWKPTDPSFPPTGRSYAAMAYDSQSDRTILFGGLGSPAGYLDDTWSYDLNTNSWTAMNPPNPPPSRYAHAMAYDSQSDRVILFGGYSPTSAELSDTWAYDFDNNTWTDMSRPFAPFPRYGHAMAYDSRSDRVILFGGLVATLPNSETWSYDFDTNTWTNMNPAAPPPALAFAAEAYDALSDRVVLFGGGTASGIKNDTWSYDLEANRWTNMGPKKHPLARQQHAMAYDAESDRVVLFGGLEFNDETWLYHLPNKPSAARSLQAFAGDTQVTLTWQTPASDGDAPITAYNVYRGTSPATETYLATLGDVLTFTDVGLTNGVTYYYEVTATNPMGEGPRSSEASATPSSGPFVPSAPVNLLAAASDARVALQWGVPASDGGSLVTGYRVYRATSSGSEALLASLGAVLTFTDAGAANGVTYYYEVSAVNGVGEGPRSNEASATPQAGTFAPSAPLNLQTAAGNGQVTLQWQPPLSDGGVPITGYKVYRGTASGSLSLLTTVGNVLGYTDSRVTNTVTYYYEVSAVNGVGEGPGSNEASATPSTTADTTSPMIAITSPTSGATLTSSAVTVSGIASDNVALSKVELSTDGTAWILATGTTSWSASLTLAEGSNTISARATDTSGNAATARVSVTVAVPVTGGGIPTSVLIGAVVAAAGVAGIAVFLFWWRRRGKREEEKPPT